MIKNKLAIIGGSGLYDVEEFTNRKFIKIDTPWGKPSDDILKTAYNNKEVFFLPRHGKGHFISPSKINFRANIDALKQLGVTDIISISAVGSLKEELAPGTFVLVDQFIDRTFARNKTFFDEDIVAHVSMAHPVSEGLMNALDNNPKNRKKWDRADEKARKTISDEATQELTATYGKLRTIRDQKLMREIKFRK